MSVNIGNKTLKTTAVSFPIPVIPRIKKSINPNDTICKIPNKKNRFVVFIFISIIQKLLPTS